MLRYSIEYDNDAIEDLREISRDIQSISSGYSADKWLGRITKRIDSLEVMPEGYPIVEIRPNLRRTRVGKYLIIYRVKKHLRQVEIVRIIYARRDLGIILPQ